MTAVDVAAIRAALDKATPGPWAIGAHIPGHEQVAWTDARAAEEGVAEWTISAPDPCPYQETANAELIVLLRNNAEALLDALAEAEARVERIENGWRKTNRSAIEQWNRADEAEAKLARARNYADEIVLSIGNDELVQAHAEAISALAEPGQVSP